MGQSVGHIIQMQRRITVIPIEYLVIVGKSALPSDWASGQS